MNISYRLKDYLKPTMEIEDLSQMQDINNQFVESKNQNWIFRGMSGCDDDLISSFESAIVEFSDTAENDVKNNLKQRQEIYRIIRGKKGIRYLSDIEKSVIRKFHRQVHQYANGEMQIRNYLSLITLMRHYGAPTRTLDWTYSFYVAVYMALRDARTGENSGVWAFDAGENSEKDNWLQATTKKLLKNKRPQKQLRDFFKDQNCVSCDIFKALFMKNTKFVYPLNPYYFNERMDIQKGVMLVPGSVSFPFEDNLVATLDKYGKKPPKRMALVKIKHAARKKLLGDLRRMNITEQTLFPGLEGFCRMLRLLVNEPDVIFPRQYLKYWSPDKIVDLDKKP
jgi:hypothetical protein